MSLEGKNVLITGGGTGVGRGVAHALAARGCRVAVCGRREDKLKEVVAAWDGPDAILYKVADVASLESVEALYRWAEESLGSVDILVNSAGTNVRDRSMADLSPEDWSKLLQINATGAFYCMKAVLPAMRKRREGMIINICSIAGKRAGLLGGVAYNASKFAMTALGTTVGLEEMDNGIRVTNIYPGEINTPILDARPVPVSDEHRARILQPEDVAAAVTLVAELHPRAHIPELVIKPSHQAYL